MDSSHSTPMGSNEEAMIRYLLGEGSEEERAQVQERLLADSDYFDVMQGVERDLMDAYVRGELTPDQRGRIASHLFGSAAQKEKRDFADALARHLNQPAQERRWRAWIVPIAAMLVLALGCGVLFRDNTQLRRETAELHARLDRPAPALPSVFSFALAPGQTRAAGAGTLVKLPDGAQFAEVQLVRETPESVPEYAVVLRTARGQERWRQAGLKPSQDGLVKLVTVWLPAALLSPGEYEAELSNGKDLMDIYNFRIQK